MLIYQGHTHTTQGEGENLAHMRLKTTTLAVLS